MQHIPGWLVGALGTSALVGAFYAGGAVHATPAPNGSPQIAAPSASPAPDGAPYPIDAVAPPVNQFTAVTTHPRVPPRASSVAGEPLEVYRPRVVRTSYPPAASAPTRRSDVAPMPDAAPTRSWKRSAVIIGSSAVVGATVGGLAKGRKGALIGAIAGGGAATVWDQVTRRRDDPRER